MKDHYRHSTSFNLESERAANHKAAAKVCVEDGHFVDQSWLRGNGVYDMEVTVTPNRPTFLHTDHRYLSGPEAGSSIAHYQHPFVVIVHLLSNALPNSNVWIFAHYLTDFQVIDQLCHFANAGLQIVGPATWNIESLQDFVGHDELRRQAVSRLHIKRVGKLEASVNSNTAVTTCGAECEGRTTSHLPHVPVIMSMAFL